MTGSPALRNDDDGSPPPVLIVGWDGAPFDLVTELLDSDALPTLNSLVDDGYFGPLDTVPYVMSSCAWSTFLTGKNAAKHGVYDFYADDFRDGSYFRDPIDATARDGQELGHILNRHDHQLGMLNVPMTYPADDTDAYTVTGMLTPSKEAPNFSHPPDFLDDFEEIDRYEIDAGEGKDADRDDFLSHTDRMVDGRFELVCYAIEREPVDVLFAVFTAPDRLSHYYYHFYDEDHPFRENESQDDLEAYEDALPSLFRDLDARLGELLERFESEYGEDPLTLVVSDHGMQSLERVFHVNKWLDDNGYLEFEPGAREAEHGVEADVEEILDDRVDYIFGKVDWANTQAYAMGKRGAIYVNLEGREPEGSVPPEERSTVVEALKRDLSDFRDPETGKEIVEATRTREELFEGPHIDRAPDLLLSLYEGYYPFGYAFELDDPAVVSTNDWPDMPFVTGIESGPGILGIAGDGVDEEAHDVDVGLVDVLPTLLYYLDLPVPEDLDGRVVQELFDSTLTHDVERDTSGGDGRSAGDATEDGQELVRDRLEDLGYL